MILLPCHISLDMGPQRHSIQEPLVRTTHNPWNKWSQTCHALSSHSAAAYPGNFPRDPGMHFSLRTQSSGDLLHSPSVPYWWPETARGQGTCWFHFLCPTSSVAHSGYKEKGLYVVLAQEGFRPRARPDTVAAILLSSMAKLCLYSDEVQ